MKRKLGKFREHFFGVPYFWIQSCFFQPIRFKQDFDSKEVGERILKMFRLMPVLFLYAYPAALLIRIALYILEPGLFPHYALKIFMPFHPVLFWFLFDATWASAVSCVIAGFVGGLFSVRFGIAVALAMTLANGVIVNTTNDTFVGIIFGISFGLMIGIAFNSANTIRQDGLEKVTITSAFSVITGLIVGYGTGTIGGYWAGYACGTLYPALQNKTNIVGSTVGLMVGSISGCFVVALLNLLVKRGMQWRDALVDLGSRIAIAVAASFGAAVGIPVGDAGVSHYAFATGIMIGLREEIIMAIGFFCFYLLSYYRLPLYPVSAYSSVQAYLTSKNKRQQALYCLRNSSLHWDECVFLPLLYLKRTLLLAAEQGLDGTLEEIRYIMRERPQQCWAAQATVYELALRDLRQRTILRDIGLAHQQLSLFVPQEVRALNAHAAHVFRSLDEASQEAASYQAQNNKEARQQALERMIYAVSRIQVRDAFSNVELNEQLAEVVKQWSMLAEQGKETLESITDRVSIDNPYAPGNPLGLRDPLFVGREDIVQKMGQALQQKHRPTFLLTGERRMGKSSILKQLPVLLGPRYLPVFYDLQTPGMLASTSAFFAAIASGIEQQLRHKEHVVDTLERYRLDGAQQQNEVAVYDLFDQWLVEVERILEQANCCIILAFDEFEKIEDAEERGTINLKLLFDWFRSTIQNRPYLALLFSGAKMIGDMGRSWAGYFVNVERVKVSFLRHADAHDLITRPVPHIFNDEVAQAIMQATHCHPFLVQAMCKQLIGILNDEVREFAGVKDVSEAIDEVFEHWAGYFWDLWDRCDRDQCLCLLALLSLDAATIEQIVEWSGVHRRKIFVALEKLQMRDMVQCEEQRYQIAIPMFAQWVEKHRQLFTPDA